MAKKLTAEKRAAILTAATQAFLDDGYETTSMDRIAARAGVSKRTIYNYFSSKEALFLAVVEQLVGKVEKARRIEWDPRRPVAEQLADFARSKSTIADNPSELALTRMALGVFVSRPTLAQAALVERDDPLVPWLEAAASAGKLAVADASRAAKVFWAMASGALFWPAVLGGSLSDDAREQLIDELVETFLARYGAEGRLTRV